MDATGIAIVVGVLVGATYALLRVWRHRSFDVGATVLALLATFSIPAGVELLQTAITGNPEALPTLWRNYVAVAGVVVIGLSLQYLARSFREAWAKGKTAQAVVSSDEDSSGGNQEPESAQESPAQ